MPKKNNPGCGCCDCPDVICKDADGNETSKQINEITFEFTGLPTDLVYWREEFDGGSASGQSRVTIFSFKSFEGTYIVERTGQPGCNLNRTVSLSLSWQTEVSDQFGACVVHDSGTATFSFVLGEFASPSDNWFFADIDATNVPLIGSTTTTVRPYIHDTLESSHFTMTRTPNPKRCDFQNLDLVLLEKTGVACPVSAVTYSGSTATVTG